MSDAPLTELEELQDLEKRRELLGWAKDNKHYLARLELILKKHLKLQKQEVGAAGGSTRVKAEGEEKKERVYFDWGKPHTKEIVVPAAKTFLAAIPRLKEFKEGTWKPDPRSRGSGMESRRYVNGEMTARIIWCEDKLVCQLGKRKEKLEANSDTEEDEEEGENAEVPTAIQDALKNTEPSASSKSSGKRPKAAPKAAAPAAASSSAEVPSDRPKRDRKAPRRG